MTYPPRRGLLELAGLMLFLAGSAVNAADFPHKPIRLIAPFAAGGSTDLPARIIAPEMARRSGQNVIVENKLGAGGSIGLAEVAKADPDGHVLGVASPPEVVRRINAVLAEVMALPDVRSRLHQIGVEPTMTSPAEFSQFIKSEIPKWARVIQVSGSRTRR